MCTIALLKNESHTTTTYHSIIIYQWRDFENRVASQNQKPIICEDAQEIPVWKMKTACTMYVDGRCKLMAQVLAVGLRISEDPSELNSTCIICRLRKGCPVMNCRKLSKVIVLRNQLPQEVEILLLRIFECWFHYHIPHSLWIQLQTEQ